MATDVPVQREPSRRLALSSRQVDRHLRAAETVHQIVRAYDDRAHAFGHGDAGQAAREWLLVVMWMEQDALSENRAFRGSSVLRSERS